jgi:hypothetical protein
MPSSTTQISRSIGGWYLKIPTIKETIKEFCQKYYNILEEHPNKLAADLIKARGIRRRLKRKKSADLLN